MNFLISSLNRDFFFKFYLPVFEEGTVLGVTAEYTPKTLHAVAADNAQYKADIEMMLNFSNLLGVNGSNTGSDTAFHTIFKSVATYCKLGTKKKKF